MNPWWLITTLVAGLQTPEPDFATEIIPVLTKAGCNSGACHGAAAGRGGFNLSLFGSDPAADFESIAQALKGRRVNTKHPSQSLVLKKPTGQINHGGDVVLSQDGAGAALLEKWIALGAPAGKSRKLNKFAIRISSPLLEKPGSSTEARAFAVFDQGPEVDVTPWTTFVSSDSSSVAVDAEMEPGNPATITVNRPGRHSVIARFLDRVIPVTLTVPVGTQPVDVKQMPTSGWIDDQINRSLSLLRLAPAQPADDATFLRRATLSLTGTLPTTIDLENFLADPSSEKRANLINRLLDSEKFTDYWTLKLARLLQVRSPGNDRESALAYGNWLKNSLQPANPMGMDQWAKSLLISTGDSRQIGPANFTRQTNDPRAQAEMVGRVFLGVRLRCANCHNHPLDRWTQDDYHGLAAVFAKLDRGPVVKLTNRGEVTNPRTGQPAIPRLPGEGNTAVGVDPRIEFADWLTKPENPLFAKAQANRIWKALFGRGLVEPVDDLRDTNPATHPALLDRLACELRDMGYDTRKLLRLIALTQAYARSALPPEGGQSQVAFYTHFPEHETEPEVLADAFSQVLGIADNYPQTKPGSRAISLYDAQSPAPTLDVLGRCQRATGCEDAVTGVGLPARLHLLNGGLLNHRIGSPGGRLDKLIQAKKNTKEIVVEFYQAGLSKNPTTVELNRWLEKLEQGPPEDRQARLEDFVWALLNSRAFATNH